MYLRSAVVLSLISLAACSSLPYGSGPVATTTLKPTAGQVAAGTVTFTQSGDKVRVEGNISGLSPGVHGIHIHEKGDCSAPDATSAGGHFNPSSKSHGGTSGAERHGGDLGNLTADNFGNAVLKVDVEGITAAPGAPNSVVGRGLIVHADADDFKTQPTGNSGKRISCGVIVEKSK